MSFKHLSAFSEKQGMSINDTCLAFAREEIGGSIPQRFEHVVNRFPERLAVKCGRKPFTYTELDTASNRVAHAILSRQGENPEPVLLLFEHGAAFIVAILGVLKAGKFYVALDPASPPDKLRTILKDTGADSIVTETKHVALAATLMDDRDHILNIENLPENTDDSLKVSLSPDSLSALFYTSGSTGQPKGVQWNHRQVLHIAWRYTRDFSLSLEDHLSLVRAYTFPASVADIASALLNGATVYPYNPRSGDGRALIDWLSQEGITIFHPPVSLFRQFLDRLAEREAHLKLRMIIVSGQTLYPSDVERFKKYLPTDCLLVNRLGSTEAGAYAQFFIDHQTEITGDAVPVGYAAKDREVLILDEAKQPVDFNTTGEIAVRSRYLSPGYWRKPELNRQKFLPDPEGGDQRIYLTGDLGRMRPDGCLEHLGRMDFQTKIRGYRVELAEIETAFHRLDSVKEAIVIDKAHQDREKYLAAYIVPANSSAPPTVSELRRSLAETLAEYMIPATFVFLDALPLTTTGKVDRQALPEPERIRPVLETPFISPTSEEEQQLARIWAEILDLDQIGIQDNFFELGGHSLQATQIVSRLQQAFHVDVSLQTFFESPNIRELADFIVKQRTSPLPESLRDFSLTSDSTIFRSTISGEYPGSFAQQRIWVLQQFEPDVPVYNMSKAMKIEGHLDIEALRQALETIIDRHDPLHTNISMVDGTPVATIAEQWTFDLPVVDLRGQGSEEERDTEARRLMSREIQRPFDLTNDLKLRGVVFHLTETEYLLVLVTHHVATDYWSAGVLNRELATLYHAFAQGQTSPLPELPIRYADFAVWQRDWVSEEALEGHLSYWKHQLGGELPVLNLPTDHPRPATQTYRGARQTHQLPDMLLDALDRLSRQEHVTLFMTLTAAFQTLLFRYTGQEDVIIGSPTAGRRPETEGLIGCFLNVIALRTDLSGNPSFRELLQRVREITVGAYAHQDPPFEYVVEQLQMPRDTRRMPVFQVMIDFLNVPEFPLELPDLSLTSLKFNNPTVLYDLILYLRNSKNGLEITIGYNTDLFEFASITRMLHHFQILLEGLVSNPAQRISELPLLTEDERHQILVAWNATQVEYPKDRCLHELFEKQVERTPDAVAVVFKDQHLSYRELNSRANQMAHYLQSLSVGPDAVVGLCVERSCEMLVGMLGILKAGGAYLPLDPGYPQGHLTFMLADSQVSILITQTQCVQIFSKDSVSKNGIRVIYLDSESEPIAQQNIANPDSNVGAENLAYVVYTSGSTGRPKGVVAAHQGTVNRFQWMWNTFPFEALRKPKRL